MTSAAVACEGLGPYLESLSLSPISTTLFFAHLRCRILADMPSNDSTGASTPNARFTSQATTADDLLSAQTVGLVQLSDFRKRRAEAIDLKEREALESGRATPSTTASTPYATSSPLS